MLAFTSQTTGLTSILSQQEWTLSKHKYQTVINFDSQSKILNNLRQIDFQL